MNEHKLTPEQESIVEAGVGSSDSLMVTAFAGCAKSTTSEALAKALPRNLQACSLAFNVKIKEETAKRFPENFSVLTMNGLGHRAWGRAINKNLKLDDKKLGRLVTAVAKEAGLNLNGEEWDSVRRLVSVAMHSGLVPEKFQHVSRGLLPDIEDSWKNLAENHWIEYTPSLLDLSREILVQDIQMAYRGEISFDDQVYCSSMLGGVFPKWPTVFVDEAQDLSPLNHVQLARCATERLIVVGDPKQAIYAFRGADSASMPKIRGLKKSWLDRPLSVTFRCPKLVVARVQEHAKGFSAFHTNPTGAIINLMSPKGASEEEKSSFSWTWPQIEVLLGRLPSNGSPPKAAILCRNNAPLLSLAFKLIRNNVSVQMLGRDIGKGLVALASKILKEDSTPADTCYGLINDWLATERQLAILNDKEEKLAGIEDRGQCLLAVLDGARCRDAGDLKRALESLFAKDVGKVILSTGHKAKGLEWDLVVHLDPWRIPSRYAAKAAAAGDISKLEQELNLEYVIETRTRHTLVLANLADFGGE